MSHILWVFPATMFMQERIHMQSKQQGLHWDLKIVSLVQFLWKSTKHMFKQNYNV